MKKSETLLKKLSYERKNFWQKSSKKERERAFEFAEGYKSFLDQAKTERETVSFFNDFLQSNNFQIMGSGNSSKHLYKVARDKNVAIAVIGEKPISEGVNLIVSHIDAPRVDLKQNPLEEDATTGLGIMKTHYYGGIKKYQWMSTPLALHGVIIKKSGELIRISIGEDKDDPVFIMPDLLPHLSQKEQYSKKIGEAIVAEHMKVIFNSIPYLSDEEEEVKNAVKLNALVLMNEKYGIVEEDLLSAELELVPAGKARDAGIDKSMVLGYGQDDRICAYTSVMAMIEAAKKDLDRTAIVFLADKEEIGSESNTGAKSIFIIDFIADLLKSNGEKNDSENLRKTLLKTQILSADVNAGINPNYPGVHEKDNAVHIGYGVSITKYTGSRGKSSSNDANAEFNAKIIRIFNEDKINWQIGTLGKVDEGGGGTIAKFMAEYGAEVIDCGPGLLGMHSLYELCNKADLYSTFKAYRTFFQKT